MSIATFLQIYRRPKYFKEQLEAIEGQTINTDELYIVHNEGGKKYNFDYPKGAQIIYADPNQKFHFRFAVALLAQTDYIAIFDDDTIPQPKWFENCLNTIEKHDCICVTTGVRVQKSKNGWGKWKKVGWQFANENEEKVDFGGHAWFLKTENLKYMWYDDIQDYDNGEDMMLSANCQIYGGIPTYVSPQPKDDISGWGSHPKKGQKYGSDGVAQWLINASHSQERAKLVKYYINQGWNLYEENK